MTKFELCLIIVGLLCSVAAAISKAMLYVKIIDFLTSVIRNLPQDVFEEFAKFSIGLIVAHFMLYYLSNQLLAYTALNQVSEESFNVHNYRRTIITDFI